jgi:hypothetical protein
MNSEKKEGTPHVASGSKIGQAAKKTMKIIVFFISFGMMYPHVFTDED